MNTSAKIQALEKQIESGKINTDKARILAYFKKNKGGFIRGVMEDLNMSERTVGARMSELEDLGLIKNDCAMQTKYAPDPQGYFRYLEDDGDRRNHRWQRHYKRREKWLKYGKENGFLTEDLIVVS